MRDNRSVREHAGSPAAAAEHPNSAPPSREEPSPTDLERLPIFLKPEEVAGLLRTTRRAIYAQIERGLLPGVVRRGRRVLVLRDVLLRSLDESRALSPGGRRR